MTKWLVLLTICLDWSLMWIDFTAVNVALPAIANDFHTNLATLQWVITAYTLCSAALMTIGGRLGDLAGHSRLFILGTLIFVLASALAGFSHSASQLILARVGQGVGIAMVVPVTTALVYLTFTRAEKGMALGFLTGTTGISMAIGPTVGGILTTYLSWRWVFFINLPIGLLAIAMAFVLIPAYKKKKIIWIDVPGAITLASGLFCLLFALNKITEWGLISFPFIGLLILTILLFNIFIFIESRTREPLIHLDLLANKDLINIIIIRTLCQFIFFVFMYIMSLYLENILNFPADKTGYLLLSSTIVLGIFSPIAGKLINYCSIRFLIATSCFLIAISLGCLIYASLYTSMNYLLVALALFGAGFAIHFPLTNFAVLNAVPSNQASLATGMLFTMAFAGASAGITICSNILTIISNNHVTPIFVLEDLRLTPAQEIMVRHVASGAQSIGGLANVVHGNLVQLLSVIARDGFVYAFNWVVGLCLCLAVIGMVLAIITLRGITLRKDINIDEVLID